MTNVDILTAPAIAALVFTVIEATGSLIPSRAKPLAAIVLGVVWALAAFFTIPGAYPVLLVAVSVGVTAGAAASGIDSMRTTYTQPRSPSLLDASSVSAPADRLPAPPVEKGGENPLPTAMRTPPPPPLTPATTTTPAPAPATPPPTVGSTSA